MAQADLFLDRPTLSLMARCKQLAHALVVHDDDIKRVIAAEFPHLTIHVRPDLVSVSEAFFGETWKVNHWLARRAGDSDTSIRSRPRQIPGHALIRGTDRWACKCGETIKDRSAGRVLARDVYRFHLLDVWMATWNPAGDPMAQVETAGLTSEQREDVMRNALSHIALGAIPCRVCGAVHAAWSDTDDPHFYSPLTAATYAKAMLANVDGAGDSGD